MRLRDLETGDEIRVFEGSRSNTFFNSPAFSPDGSLIATGENDGSVRLWDRDSGKVLRRYMGHEATVHSVAFSDDGRKLASGSADGTARVWRVEPRR
jgi:WD40 repeat protein